jgi:hypothetical protein
MFEFEVVEHFTQKQKEAKTVATKEDVRSNG